MIKKSIISPRSWKIKSNFERAKFNWLIFSQMRVYGWENIFLKLRKKIYRRFFEINPKTSQKVFPHNISISSDTRYIWWTQLWNLFDCEKGNFLLSALNAVASCLGKQKTFHSDETKFTYAHRASTAVISRACARGSVFARCVPISHAKAKRNT